MSLLKVIDDAPGYLKATFQGPQGSGKSRTGSDLACVAHKFFGSKKPIAFYDTESGSDYLAQRIDKLTGMKPLRVKTRAFSDLREVVKECLNGASDILVVDSITHVWRELMAAYLKKANQGSRYQKKRLELYDIMQVKELWAPWPDEFLMTPLHIIVCGREGNEWGHEENEETGKRDLVATGKKMKVEAEFGYEASLQISMSAVQIAAATINKGRGKKEKRASSIVNVATVMKDRFDLMNGMQFEMPTGEEFLPFLERLVPARHVEVNNDVKSDVLMPSSDGEVWQAEKRKRVILCEEIQGAIVKFYPGQTAKEKAAKAALLDRAFRTRSWTRVESMESTELSLGLETIRGILEDPAGFEHDLQQGVKLEDAFT